MVADIQDPRITMVMRTGYSQAVHNQTRRDFFGNEVFEGDEILVYDDEVFLIGEISNDLWEFLKFLGASYEIAK